MPADPRPSRIFIDANLLKFADLRYVYALRAVEAADAFPSFLADLRNFVTVDPTGRFVYVANLADSNVGMYSIAASGSLAPITGSPFPAGSGPNWIAISPGRRRTHPVYSAMEIPTPSFLPVQLSNGNFHRLPTFNGGTYSLPGGINNGGAVVGTSDVSGGGPTRAFLYTDGELTDLNNIVEPVLPLLTSASGINDKGQILATGLNGQSYVLTSKRAVIKGFHCEV